MIEIHSLESEVMNHEEIEIHLILIGHAGVGKTSLKKHLKNVPIEKFESPTLVMESDAIRFEESEAKRFSLTLWDTGGHPIFQDLLPCFARFRCMYGLVFKLTDIVFFDSCPDIRSCGKDSETVSSPFSNRDIIHRNLAFIQAFSSSFREKSGDAGGGGYNRQSTGIELIHLPAPTLDLEN